MNCKHKFVHLRTEGWYESYRFTNSFHLIDFFFCEKCLEEKKVEKVANDVSIYKETPEWAKSITKRIDKSC